MDPRHIVAIQLKTLIAEGMAMKEGQEAEHRGGEQAHTGDEHVVRPNEEAQQCNRDGAEGDGLVAEDGLLAEGRDYFRDHGHGRQDHDVDGRMGVKPEEMLEEHGIAAEGGIKDADAQHTLKGDQKQRNRQDGVARI